LGPALNGICRFVVEEFLEKMFLLENQFAGNNHKKLLQFIPNKLQQLYKTNILS
jgi:hypothetical protein